MEINLKRSVCNLSLLCGVVINILNTTANSANANFFYDFENPIPQDSIFTAGVTLDGNLIPIEANIETTLDGNSFLRLKNDQSAIEGGSVSSFFGNIDQIFEDVKVSAILNLAGDSNDEVAVLARAELSTLSSYALNIDFKTGRLRLGKTIGGQNTLLADAFNVFPSLNEAYLAELEVIGNNLTGRVFDASGNVELFSLSATDNSLVSGTSGVAVGVSQTALPDFDNPNNATFDNLSSRTISVFEPSSLLSLLALGTITTLQKGNKKPR